MRQVLLEAFTGLLGEFRQGHIADRQSGQEETACRRWLREVEARWDARFPGFPRCRLRYASFKGVLRRGLRDRYLKSIIVRTLTAEQGGFDGATIVNPVCVFGRHARDVARDLKMFRVLATDIDPHPNWIYGHLVPQRIPANYTFKQDNIFEPTVQVEPAAVVFFGACGSLSDAAMDFAVQSHARYLICRTCCHENLGQNTVIVKRPTTLNRLFRIKNFMHAKVSSKKEGFYFSPRYSPQAYPRSQAARALVDPEEYMEVAKNTVDSDICRAIIDLDRCLWLTEKGYNVLYKGEVFFAERAQAERPRECNG
jgi:hypothetical protein